MPRVTPEEFVRKHSARVKAAIDDMRQGVEKVTEAPGRKAAAAADKWHAKISALETKERWAANVAAVSLEEWKAKMLAKGVNRVAAGVDAAQDKILDFATQLLAYQERLQAEIHGMPNLTLEDNIQRMNAWVRGMARFSYRRQR